MDLPMPPKPPTTRYEAWDDSLGGARRGGA